MAKVRRRSGDYEVCCRLLHGPPSTEKCLTYDDKPLQLMLDKRGSSKEQPVFYLRSIRVTESIDNLVSKEMRNSGKDLRAFIKDGHLSGKDHARISKLSDATQSVILASVPVTDEPKTASQLTAVAIYEYKAERDDEFDVGIGDKFIVRDTSTAGWWIVERNGETGWVPSGILMENSNEEDGLLSVGDPVEGVALFDHVSEGMSILGVLPLCC